MSFLTKRTNPLNRFFFQKMQEQISKAPGFKPLLSYEDFEKLVNENIQVDTTEKTEDNA